MIFQLSFRLYMNLASFTRYTMMISWIQRRRYFSLGMNNVVEIVFICLNEKNIIKIKEPIHYLLFFFWRIKCYISSLWQKKKKIYHGVRFVFYFFFRKGNHCVTWVTRYGCKTYSFFNVTFQSAIYTYLVL